MILIFLQFIRSLGVKIPFAFTYASTRMIFAAIFTLLMTILVGKVFIKKLYALKIGHTIRVGDVAFLANQYDKSKDVPSMGGILILTSVLTSAFLWMDLTHAFTLILVITALWMGLLGGVDDYLKIKKVNSKGVSPRVKMVWQVILSSILGLYLFSSTVSSTLEEKEILKAPVIKEKNFETGKLETIPVKEYGLRYYIPFCKKPIVLGSFGVIFAFAFVVFVLSGSTNAVNLSDGLDGLAAGLSLMVALVLALVAFLSNNVELSSYLNILYIDGASEIAIFLSSLAGALLGFLWFNGYPAQVFMGDTGSLAIGGILGVSSILLRREFLFALVGGLFVIETLSVILQVLSFKFRGGKRIFKCAPLHHHFEMEGVHEVKIVLRFWMIGLLLALIGIASLKIQ